LAVRTLLRPVVTVDRQFEATPTARRGPALTPRFGGVDGSGNTVGRDGGGRRRSRDRDRPGGQRLPPERSARGYGFWSSGTASLGDSVTAMVAVGNDRTQLRLGSAARKSDRLRRGGSPRGGEEVVVDPSGLATVVVVRPVPEVVRAVRRCRSPSVALQLHHVAVVEAVPGSPRRVVPVRRVPPVDAACRVYGPELGEAAVR
jgi:hypothetical protein